MPQGKLKVKSKLPDNVKNKKKAKGNAATQRINRPIQHKKSKKQAQNLKKAITTEVNKAVEAEIRSRVIETKKPTLSNAQQAVAAHNKAK